LSYTSSLFPAINKLGRSPATSVINSPSSVAAKCIALAAGTLHSSLRSQILVQNRDFCLPHLHSTPPLRGFPSEYCHAVQYEKNRMVWLPDGENFFEDIFIRFDRMYERDRHTHTPHDGISRACIASRGKNPALASDIVYQSAHLVLLQIDKDRKTVVVVLALYTPKAIIVLHRIIRSWYTGR